MATDVPGDLLRAVWEYPLFDALYGRRTRRFGLGFEMAQGPYQYRSSQAPVPLCEDEEALLVATGIGFSGMALWDQSRPLPYRNSDGRTFPSTSRGRRTALFFTNDRGVYVIDPGAGSTDQMREADGPDGWAAAIDFYNRHRLTLQPSRLDIPRRVPPFCGHNLWASNMPGSTLFMPICDVTFSLIGLIAQFVDARLERFAAANGRGVNIVDDRFGFRPAGTEAWIKSGFLDQDSPLALTHLERQACYFMFSEPAAICQNMFLATEAIGLGGWMHCGILSREIFEALGFTIVERQGGLGLPNPVGLDRVFQAYCPPYFESMDAAVDTVLRPLLRERSTPSTADSSQVPYRISTDDHRNGAVAVSEEGIACTKAVCNYIQQTYGRFPGTVDAMHLMWLMQAHHLDTDYYDRFFRPGAYGPTHAAHMANWHPSKRPGVSARKIRRAAQSDLAMVQGISADAYIAAYVPVLGYVPLPAEEDYGSRIEHGGVWLLACGDSDVGVAVLEERRDHLLVYSIAVRPTEQGRGHGRALLDFADQRAAALGLAEIRLYTNIRMEKNIALYRRHGYVETGTRPHPSRAGEVLVDMVSTGVTGTV